MFKITILIFTSLYGSLNSEFVAGYKLGASVGDRFYKLHIQAKTWDEAALVCQSENAKLAVVNSDEEARIFGKELLSKHNEIPDKIQKGVAFIGIHDRLTEGHFTALDGTPLNQTGYSKWSPGQPDNAGNKEDCGQILSDGLLNDISCDARCMFFCEKPYISEELVERTVGLLDNDITDGLHCETFQGGYKLGASVGDPFYKLNTQARTWDEASLVCQSEKAKLAVVNSDQEARIFGEELLSRHNEVPDKVQKDVAFVGIHDRLIEGHFIALDGTPLNRTGYSKWSPGQPDNAWNNEHCGQILSEGLLNDISCDVRCMFFCEKPYISEELAELHRSLSATSYRTAGLLHITDGLHCETFEGGYKLGASVGDRFYKLHIQARTWDEASLVCQSEKAKLAVVNSDEEAQIFGEELLSKHNVLPDKVPKGVAFIGIHDRLTKGHFIALDGTPLNQTGYSKWSPGQPDNAGNKEHCGQILLNELLNDISCDSRCMFFCEKSYISEDLAELRRSLRDTPYRTADVQDIDIIDGQMFERGKYH